jgi:hypothetical protein
VKSRLAAKIYDLLVVKTLHFNFGHHRFFHNNHGDSIVWTPLFAVNAASADFEVDDRQFFLHTYGHDRAHFHTGFAPLTLFNVYNWL